MAINKHNSEGYNDPTGFKAVSKILKEQEKPQYMPIVYICSPYSGDVENNVKKAREYCRFAYEQDVIPFAPHLLFPQFLNDNNFIERTMVMKFNYIFLRKCEQLWVFGTDFSEGMSAEIQTAKRLKIQIKYFDVKYTEVRK